MGDEHPPGYPQLADKLSPALWTTADGIDGTGRRLFLDTPAYTLEN
jgi:hypothetical protein